MTTHRPLVGGEMTREPPDLVGDRELVAAHCAVSPEPQVAIELDEG